MRLGRSPRASVYDLAALAALALIVLVVFLDEPHVLPRRSEALNLSPGMLPLYALYSTLRMLAAYVCSLLFAIVAGYFAAFSAPSRRVILPTLDVLQSVPILGFFPAAVFVFIRLFGGSVFGTEAAAVFLIFTSQAWNLAFSVYESLTTIPDDIEAAVRVSGATGLVRWRRLIIPACVPGLTYNSMLSWAAGWYFLIASEVIAVGRQTYTLPGLGSYIAQSVSTGRTAFALLGIAALLGVIILLHAGAWSPLEFVAERFRYEYGTAGARRRPPVALTVVERATLLRRVARRLASASLRVAGSAAARAGHLVSGVPPRAIWPMGVLVGLGLLGYLSLGAVRVLFRPLPPQAWGLPLSLLYSFLRLLVAYLITLAWTVPLGAWLSRDQARAARVMPAAQILASLPATAFFPFIVAVIVALRLDFNVAAITLVLTGMQWYLLFNLVAAAQALPADLRELALATQLRGWLYLKRIYLPAAMPHLVTGSITAWGGGWNALVISEAVSAGGRTFAVRGIGAMLDEATYVTGDLQLIVLIIVAMVVAITALNRLFWRPLYAYAAERYRLE